MKKIIEFLPILIFIAIPILTEVIKKLKKTQNADQNHKEEDPKNEKKYIDIEEEIFIPVAELEKENRQVMNKQVFKEFNQISPNNQSVIPNPAPKTMMKKEAVKSENDGLINVYDLNNKENLKRAFIASEILKRKY